MRDIGFDARLTVAWAFTLLALAVLAGGTLPSKGAGALVVVLALSAFIVWVRGHVFRKGG